jgi:hypothetical protein
MKEIKLILNYKEKKKIGTKAYQIFQDKEKDYEIRIVEDHPIFLDNKPVANATYEISWEKEGENLPSDDKPIIYTFEFDDEINCSKKDENEEQNSPNTVKIKDCSKCIEFIQSEIAECKD